MTRAPAVATPGGSRAPAAIVGAAAALHLALALATDLSPDEAYYLCAAREGRLVPSLVDHPPLVPWMLRLTDALPGLPIELRVRLWPIGLAAATSAACIALARSRGAGAQGMRLAAWASTWALLPTASGFVATPDGPAVLALLVALLWAHPPRWLGSSTSSLRSYLAGSAATAVALGLGVLAKVVVLPLGAAIVLASERPLRARLAVLVPALLASPLALPSVAFQLGHAFVPGRVVPPGAAEAWSAGAAAGSLAGALASQALLWSPLLLGRGLRYARRLPRPDRGALGLVTALVGVSALGRAHPPEANWWLPGAFLVVVAASLEPRGDAAGGPSRMRLAMLASFVAPTLVAAAHTVRPFLPLPPHLDPTARLHGWSEGRDPVGAAGVGPYGPAAERCVYRRECDDIASYFDEMRANRSSLASGFDVAAEERDGR